MSGFVRPAVFEGGLQRPARVGDIIKVGMKNGAMSADADSTITVEKIAGGLVIRTGALAGRTDTTATAALILAAYPEMDIGDSFSIIYANQSTQTITLAGGTGVTLSGDTTVETLTHKHLLFTKTSATAMTMDIL